MMNQRGVPVEAFPTRELEERINVLPNGKARYPPIKLSDCELMKLTQYKCHPEPKTRQVVCKPFMRIFRKWVQIRTLCFPRRVTQCNITQMLIAGFRCAGDMMIETTEWEWIRIEDEVRQEVEQLSKGQYNDKYVSTREG